MIDAVYVLKKLCPNYQWVMRGDKYEDIEWLEKDAPITAAQFEAGIAQYNAWKSEQDAAKAAQKAALLDRLGITEEEAKLLLA
jgi:hypothetical protein